LDPGPSFISQVKQAAIRMFGVRYYDLVRPHKKGRIHLSVIELDLLNQMQPTSLLTKLLMDKARGMGSLPFVRLDYLMQACIYLNYLEQTKNVKFDFRLEYK
jgi:hypothetical protein